MPHYPAYLWVLTFAATGGIAGVTIVVLYRGGRQAGMSSRRSGLLGAAAALVFFGWAVISAVIADQGGYLAHRGGGHVPWLPLTNLSYLAVLLLLTRVPVVQKALRAPGMNRNLVLPHTVRLAGIIFLIAMIQGYLPAIFAVPAGVGDMSTGIVASLAARKLARGDGRKAALWFNALGITDLVTALILGSLAGFFLHVTPSAQAITELPLVLIPTVTVPILFALHFASVRSLSKSRHAVPALGATPAIATRHSARARDQGATLRAGSAAALAAENTERAPCGPPSPMKRRPPEPERL